MAQTSPSTGAMIPEKERIVELLKEVIDPELGVNIIDLGLVYDIRLDEEAGRVAIDLTLSTPACPMGEVIINGAYHILYNSLGGLEVDINLVWEPAWSIDRLTAEGRAALGR